MTTQPTSFSQFGQTLAFAERALTATLRQHLAERGTTPETWYALQLIATRGPSLGRDALIRDLAGSPALDAVSAAELLGLLEADGLICGDSELDLTTKGSAFHASLREYIAMPRDELLGQFDVEDIDTTVRTLQAITESATARLDS
jgi:hypothetical protein